MTEPTHVEPDQPADALAAETDAAASKLATRITELPAGVRVATNLDTFENEKPDKPFWFQHGNAFFRLLDPDNVDFDDVTVVQENPRLMMHILLDPEQRGAYFEVTQGVRGDDGEVVLEPTPMRVGKMKKLIGDYTKHFGLTDLGELAGSARR